MVPILTWFNEKVIAKKLTERGLKKALWWFGFIAAFGVAIGVVIAGFKFFFMIIMTKIP